MSKFGWCLPDAPVSVHSKCIARFDYGKEIVCDCLCHTDNESFLKEMNKSDGKTNKKRTKGVDKTSTPDSKSDSVPDVAIEGTSQRRRSTLTATTKRGSKGTGK